MAENTIIHEISLAGYKATSPGGMLDLGTWGSYGIEKLHLTLDAAWQDLTITAFFNVNGKVVAKRVVGKDGYADVPWEATKENTFSGCLAFEGSINGQRRISTNLNYKVTNHSETTDSDPVPTDDRWNQFVTETKEYRDGAFEAAKRANARAEDAEAASEDAQAAARAAKASENAAAASASNAAADAAKAGPYAEAARAAQEAAESARDKAIAAQQAAENAAAARRTVRAQRIRWRRRLRGLPWRRRIPRQRPTMRPTSPERMPRRHSRQRPRPQLPPMMQARAPATQRQARQLPRPRPRLPRTPRLLRRRPRRRP